MENTENRKMSALGWTLIAASVVILFTCGFLTALVGIDYPPHEQIAMSLTPADPVPEGLTRFLEAVPAR